MLSEDHFKSWNLFFCFFCFYDLYCHLQYGQQFPLNYIFTENNILVHQGDKGFSQELENKQDVMYEENKKNVTCELKIL